MKAAADALGVSPTQLSRLIIRLGLRGEYDRRRQHGPTAGRF